MNLLPVLRFNPSYENFKEAANDKDFLGGIDDEIDIEDDTANEIARELWLDTLTDSNGDSSLIVTFSHYMNLLQLRSLDSHMNLQQMEMGKLMGWYGRPLLCAQILRGLVDTYP
jgi:hypothetical protein